MNDQERDLITNFVQRVGGQPASSGFAGSVPQVGAAPLPPVDPAADALLAELFQRQPEARYRVTQLAFIQEHALAEATNQINALQMQLQQARAQAAPPPPAASPWGAAAQAPQPTVQAQPGRGLFGGFFGGSQPAAQPQAYQQPAYAPPPPQYAPGYQPGMFQQRGSGFLGSALTTAAGVAGGMMAANALSGLFSGEGRHEAAAASFVPQPGISAPEASPWSAPAAPVSDPYNDGGAQKDYASNTDYTPAPDSGWQDAASDNSGGGWSDAGGSDTDV